MKPIVNLSVNVARRAARFLGPVAGAIQGELSKQETARALAKAVVVGAATRASLAATLHRPDVLSDVVVPLAAAAFTGGLDALSRWQQGDLKPATTTAAPGSDAVPPAPRLPGSSNPQRP